MSDRIEFESHRFGLIEVNEAELITFPGLPGFPSARRFVVMEHDRESLFAWLVCVDDPDLSFAITDPWQFFPEYEPPLELRHLKSLGVEGPDDLVIMTVATLGGSRTCINLVAPLLINPNRRCGEQVILDRSDYSHRAELPAPPPEKPAAGTPDVEVRAARGTTP